MQVSEVKAVIKNEMIAAGDAILYSGAPLHRKLLHHVNMFLLCQQPGCRAELHWSMWHAGVGHEAWCACLAVQSLRSR
jgi:hypothetical protein